MDEIYRILRTLRFCMSACKILDTVKKITGIAAGVLCALFALKLFRGSNCKMLKKW